MPADDALEAALVALIRQTTTLTRVAAQTLGAGTTGNRDIDVLLAVHRSPGLRASQVASTVGIDRTAASRSLRHLKARSLARDELDPGDRRSRRYRLTPAGRARVAAFERRVATYFAENATTVAEVLPVLGSPAPLDGVDNPTPLEAVALLVRAGAVYAAAASAAVRPYGVTTPAERFTLSLLHHHHHGCRPGRLAADLGLSRAAATLLLDRMQTADLVERRPLASDGRGVLATLTPTGAQAAGVALAVFRDHACDIGRALATASQAATARGVT